MRRALLVVLVAACSRAGIAAAAGATVPTAGAMVAADVAAPTAGAMVAADVAAPTAGAMVAAGVTAPTAGAMVAAMDALRTSLSPAALEEVQYRFEDDERFDLRLAPFFLDGVPLREMDDRSRTHVAALLDASLGPFGRGRVDAIRALEDEVLQRQRDAGWHRALWARWSGIWGRDLYYLTLYGDPGSPGAWGYRFDGHHLSVNFTVVDGEVSGTPFFLGAEPRESAAGIRVLEREEDLARALLASLESSQRGRAILDLEPDRGAFVGSGSRLEVPIPPAGIARGDLAVPQQERFDELLEAYLENVAAPVAARERARIDAAGRDAIYFAWAGSDEPGRPMYYRLQGPTLLIEFDNTVDDADHIHALWRDAEGDFGHDLLTRHHADAHGAPAGKD